MVSTGQRARRHGAVYGHLVGAHRELHVCMHEPHESTCRALCACMGSMDPQEDGVYHMCEAQGSTCEAVCTCEHNGPMCKPTSKPVRVYMCESHRPTCEKNCVLKYVS